MARKEKTKTEDLKKKQTLKEESLDKLKKEKEDKEKEENKQRSVMLNAIMNGLNIKEEKKEKKEKPEAPKMDKSYPDKLKRAQTYYQAATWISKAVCIPLAPVAIALAFNPLTSIASIILLGISLTLMCAGIFVFPELKDTCEEMQIKYETDVVAPKYASDYKKYVEECYQKGYEPEGNNNTFTQHVDYDYDVINQRTQNASQTAQQQDAQPQK